MPRRTRWQEFAAGVRAELPLLLGVAPFGTAYGAFADSGLSSGLAQSMSAIVFGGASQFAGTKQMAAGEVGVIIVLTAALVNLRHMLYSASLAPHVAHLPRRWRALLGYLLTDEAYAVGITRYRSNVRSAHAHWFVLGACVALWVCWQVTTAIGVFGARAVPESWELDFALPLTFIAVVVPGLRDRPMILAAVVAGAVAVLGHGWQYSTGLFTAAVAGMAAGLALESLVEGAPMAAGGDEGRADGRAGKP